MRIYNSDGGKQMRQTAVVLFPYSCGAMRIRANRLDLSVDVTARRHQDTEINVRVSCQALKDIPMCSKTDLERQASGYLHLSRIEEDPFTVVTMDTHRIGAVADTTALTAMGREACVLLFLESHGQALLDLNAAAERQGRDLYNGLFGWVRSLVHPNITLAYSLSPRH